MKQNTQIAETLGRAKAISIPDQQAAPRRVEILSASDREQSISTLKAYVNAMVAGNVALTLKYVDDTVLVDGVSNSKPQLRQTYAHWLDEATSRKYTFDISEVVVHNGLVRVKGAAYIKFKYTGRRNIGYRGVLYFDIQPSEFGGKIVAITRG